MYMNVYRFYLEDNFGEDFIEIQAHNMIMACEMFAELYPEVFKEDIKKIEIIQ